MKSLFLLTVLFLSSCAIIVDDQRPKVYHPDLAITGTELRDSNSIFDARLIITLKNKGRSRAENVYGRIKLYRNNRLFQTEYFNIDHINEFQIVSKTIYLDNIDRHSDYDYYILDMEWYDRNGNQYEY
jgi:hypothetical protein